MASSGQPEHVRRTQERKAPDRGQHSIIISIIIIIDGMSISLPPNPKASDQTPAAPPGNRNPTPEARPPKILGQELGRLGAAASLGLKTDISLTITVSGSGRLAEVAVGELVSAPFVGCSVEQVRCRRPCWVRPAFSG